jgi:HD superfamily phosphohydrolase
MKFRDILYGEIVIPDWLVPFLTMPEFVRLRGVRLSNIDSIEFKDFGGPMRWEHSIGVAHLALRIAKLKSLSLEETVKITLAALLHDVGTPPFAHTVEHIIYNFDHEEEAVKLLSEGDRWGTGVFAGEEPQFHKLCENLNKSYRIKIDPKEVADLITGNGKNGFLINGSIDLDNIDNLIRACLFLGKDIDKKLPYELLKWLSKYQSAPTDIYSLDEEAVKRWIEYRGFLYGSFFNSTDIELGRQAFLQHIIRRAFNEGLTKKSVIWSTDESLLFMIENHKANETEKKMYPNTLKSLVKSFRMLEKTYKYTSISIENNSDLRKFADPEFANWLEKELSNEFFEPFVIVNQRKYKDNKTLFSPHVGEIQIYKLTSAPVKIKQLPEFIKKEIQLNVSGVKIESEFSRVLRDKINQWTQIEPKPWKINDKKREDDIISNLEQEKDWSFKCDSNRSINIHTYPATFVNTIPKRLISSLGLRGETILDPFGGTGQTAEAALKLDCDVITSDNNTIANLATLAKFSYLGNSQRQLLNDISNRDHFITQFETDLPQIDEIKRWYSAKTLNELIQIQNYIYTIDDDTVNKFLLNCFSDILISCSSRKGKGHSYFADNTPLAKGQKEIPYLNAINLFTKKIEENISIIDQLYSLIERKNKDPKEELERIKIYKRDVISLTPSSINISENSVAGIITSPPYLCMIDYTLGQRLSYLWLFPHLMDSDFGREIGARRNRTNPEKALNDYLENIRLFATNAKSFLRKDGYLATVFGAPTANSFKDKDIIGMIDKTFLDLGFRNMWDRYRPISKHRNHGLTSLDKERISVHILE